MTRPPPSPTLFPYTTLFRSDGRGRRARRHARRVGEVRLVEDVVGAEGIDGEAGGIGLEPETPVDLAAEDRKSTRLNSSHVSISYAVFCLKKKSATVCPRTAS